MSNDFLFDRVIHRAIAAGVNTTHLDEVVIFLEKEIEQYRDKIERLEAYIDGKVALIASLENSIKKQNTELMTLRGFRDCVNSHYGMSQLEAVQENTAAEIIGALADNGYNISINLFKNDESEGAE